MIIEEEKAETEKIDELSYRSSSTCIELHTFLIGNLVTVRKKWIDKSK